MFFVWFQIRFEVLSFFTKMSNFFFIWFERKNISFSIFIVIGGVLLLNETISNLKMLAYAVELDLFGNNEHIILSQN